MRSGTSRGFPEWSGNEGQPTPGKPIGLGGGAPALGGLVGQPKKALCAIDRKSKRKEKKEEVGKGGRTPPSKPSWTRFGRGGFPPLARPNPLGVLGPQGKAPPLPPIYTEVLGLI